MAQISASSVACHCLCGSSFLLLEGTLKAHHSSLALYKWKHVDTDRYCIKGSLGNDYIIIASLEDVLTAEGVVASITGRLADTCC